MSHLFLSKLLFSDITNLLNLYLLGLVYACLLLTVFFFQREFSASVAPTSVFFSACFTFRLPKRVTLDSQHPGWDSTNELTFGSGPLPRALANPQVVNCL